MRYLAIFASSVFAVSLALTGAMAAETGYQGTGAGGYGSSQGTSGMGSQSDQGMSGQQGLGSQSGAAQEGVVQADAEQIRQVQQQLRSLGFAPGNIEGELDAQTMEAIRNFQQAQGMQPTGQLNAQTLQALGVGGQEGQTQDYYGVSPEFDQSRQPTQQSPEGIQQPGQQMDRQQLDRGQMNQQMDRQMVPQQSQPQGTMGR